MCSTRGEQMSLHSLKFHSNQSEMEYFAPSLAQAWSYLGAFFTRLMKINLPQVGPNCVDFLFALSEYWIKRSTNKSIQLVTTCEKQ
jgi:hypothetical protein